MQEFRWNQQPVVVFESLVHAIILTVSPLPFELIDRVFVPLFPASDQPFQQRLVPCQQATSLVEPKPADLP